LNLKKCIVCNFLALSTQEAPPLVPRLANDRCHIKWTQLTDLPESMFKAFVAVQDKKVYVAGGLSPNDNAMHKVYVYDVNNNYWGHLPPSGQYRGVPHIIGGRLTIIGGHLSSNGLVTNKVSTFDKASQTWISYYPDLLSVRDRPGVVTYLEHVITAGGFKGDRYDDYCDDIEVLHWTENTQWIKVSTKLPEPMGCFMPIISSDHYVIASNRYVYTVPVSCIVKTSNSKWVTIGTPKSKVLIPSSSPPVVVGGKDGSQTKSDIQMYDEKSKSWRKIASLSSARAYPAIAVISTNTIIVIGGCTKTKSYTSCRQSSLTTVELGQIQ